MQAVLPLDSSCEDLEVDSSLSFLDGFVSEAMAQGAQAYQPLHLRSNAVVPKPQRMLRIRKGYLMIESGMYTVQVYH